jgi:hypothetical protein
MIETWVYGDRVPYTLVMNLVCDTCGASRTTDGASYEAMRAAATALGWRETATGNRRVLCPNC